MAERAKRPDEYMPSRAKRSSPLGTTVFIGLRFADIAVQYYLLNGGASRLVSAIGGKTVTLANSPFAKVLLGLSAVGSFKQIYWLASVSENEMPIGQAFSIALFNTAVNSIFSFLASWGVTSLASSHPGVLSQTSVLEVLLKEPILGSAVALFLVGISLETISEVQRRDFKADPKNKGKPYGGGLFRLARHVNYSGYLLWRTANYLAAAGIVPAVVSFIFFFYNFAGSSIPSLDKVSLKY